MNRAAFLIPHPYVDALACFREPIRFLAQKGWDVDLYTMLSPENPPPSFAEKNISVVPIRIDKTGALNVLSRLVFARPKYRVIFSVPQWGLHYAALASSFSRTPVICISDEIYTESESASPAQKKWKALEKKAHQKCAATVALSKDRAEFIRAENELPSGKPVFIVPNSSPGPAKRLESRYFYETLGIPATEKIVVHAGSWWWRSTVPHTEQILGTGGASGYTFVFHGRNKAEERYESAYPNIRFSHSVLPSSMIDHAVSSAHIGLAVYDQNNVNHRLVGTATGKIPVYLKNSLPVIVTHQPSLEWVEKEGCGICVKRIEDIPDACRRIDADYGRYADRAKKLYDEKFDFTANFRPVMEFLEKI